MSILEQTFFIDVSVNRWSNSYSIEFLGRTWTLCGTPGIIKKNFQYEMKKTDCIS
jgi:hypothetical protein